MSSENLNSSSNDKMNSTITVSSDMWHPALDKFYSVFGITICIVGFIANLSVVLAFITHRRLRTKVNAFLVSLAISDLLLTGISMPLELEWHIRSEFIHDAIVCDLLYTTYFLNLTSSSLNLLLLSIYRYLSIAFPFFMKRVSSHHVLLALGASWLYSGITASLPIMGWRRFPTVTHRKCLYSFEKEFILFILTTNWLSPAILVFFFYGLIFRIARIQAIKILKNKILTDHEKIRSPLFKGAKTLAKIATVYLICWFPYVTEILLVVAGAVAKVPSEVHYLFVFLCYTSAAINPFLYAGLCKDFRQVFRKCAGKASRQLTARFRCLWESPCRFVAARWGGVQKVSKRWRRSRMRSGSSSVYHQPTAASLVWNP